MQLQTDKIRVPYDSMNFYYTYDHYDIHLSGVCIHNGKLAKYETHDLTDYQTMTDTCPSCGPADQPLLYCHCEPYTDVVCEITELPLLKRIGCWLDVHITLKIKFIRRWGLDGMPYWRNWYKR